MKFQKVKIIWRDIVNNNDWINFEDIKDIVSNYKKERYHSIGYLVYKDKDVLMLAYDISYDHKGEAELISYTLIPRGAILKIKKLNEHFNPTTNL